MKVVLLDNIRGIGQVGDVRDVSDGYARNFLLRRNIARAATPGAVRDAVVVTSRRRAAQEITHAAAQELATRLSGMVIPIVGKANEKGTLFAAILSVLVDGTTFDLPEHIKTTGEHPVTLRLADGVTAAVTVSVTAA